MNEKPYNPNDPLFLFSRSLDEALSEPDRKRLATAMASDGFRREAEELAGADRLLKRWAVPAVDLDADSLVFEAIAAAEHDEVDPIDQVLSRWGRKPVDVDWDRFTATVMARVQPGRRMPAMYRWALPLAAAAAVGFAVLTAVRSPDARLRENVVRYGPSNNAIGGTRLAMATPMIVSYGPPPGEEGFTTPSGPQLSYGSVGSSPIVVSSYESPPL